MSDGDNANLVERALRANWLERSAVNTWEFAKRNRWWIIAVVGAFTAVAGVLLVLGRLGDVYAYLYRTFPGRPWTYVMRQYPWIYLIGALVILLILLWGTNIQSLEGKVRVFTVWAVFLVGFLGGHVFWGSSGPGYSWCDTALFDVNVDPHERVVAPADGEGVAISFRVSIGSRIDPTQPRSAWEVNIEDVLTSFAEIAPDSFDPAVDVETFWIKDDSAELAIVIKPGGPVAAGEARGQIVVTDLTADPDDRDGSCELRRPYIIEGTGG